MASEVVHDNDVTETQCRDEDLFDVGAKALAIDRAIDDARSSETIGTQGCKEGRGSPSTMRHFGEQSLTLGATPAQRRHVGLGPGLVDKYQALQVNSGLVSLPLLAPPRDVRPVLLLGVQSFF